MAEFDTVQGNQFLLLVVEVDAKKISLSTYIQKLQSLLFLFQFGGLQIKNDMSQLAGKIDRLILAVMINGLS